MKQLFFILILFLSCSACIKGDKNGDLDGMWQLQTVEYSDGKTTTPLDHYMSIELDLVQFQNPLGSIVGHFQYTGDSLRLNIQEGSMYYLEGFGLTSMNEHLGVMINSSKMILRTPHSTSYYRKW